MGNKGSRTDRARPGERQGEREAPEGPDAPSRFSRRIKANQPALERSSPSFVRVLSSGEIASIDGHYTLGEEAGNSSNSVVFRAAKAAGGPEVWAVKRTLRARLNGREDTFRHELENMRALKGAPHVLSLEEAFETEDHLDMVMPLCEGGDLTDFLREQPELDERRVADIVDQLLEAVEAAHERSIIHCDIKPENVLFRDRERTEVMLADWGLSQTVGAEGELTHIQGTVQYLAPETIRGHFDAKADVWAVGVLAHILLCGGEAPFEGSSNRDIMAKIAKGKTSSNMCRALRERSRLASLFVLDLLKQDPARRPAAAAARAHPFLRKSLSPPSPTAEGPVAEPAPA